MLKVSKDQSRQRRGLTALASIVVSASLLTTAAYAQNSESSTKTRTNAWSTQTLTITPSTREFDFKTETQPLNSDLSTEVGLDINDSLLSLNNDSRSSLFNLGEGGQLCFSTSAECNDDDTVELGLSRDFSALEFKGVDLAVTPRAGISFDDDRSSALVGALVRIGDNLDARSVSNPNTWYLFAGADAQAMSYEPGNNNPIDGADRFFLRNDILVGDAQAGLGYRIGGADLSLTYLRREARAENYKFEEDTASLSFTWRR